MLDAGCWIRPPTRLCPLITQMTQMDADPTQPPTSQPPRHQDTKPARQNDRRSGDRLPPVRSQFVPNTSVRRESTSHRPTRPRRVGSTSHSIDCDGGRILGCLLQEGRGEACASEAQASPRIKRDDRSSAFICAICGFSECPDLGYLGDLWIFRMGGSGFAAEQLRRDGRARFVNSWCLCVFVVATGVGGNPKSEIRNPFSVSLWFFGWGVERSSLCN